MEHRRLGRTNLQVSRMGWGTVKLGRDQGVKYPEAFSLPTEADALAIVHAMLDLGITLIDTAPAYGLAQSRLGLAMGSRRDDIVLVSKVGETFDIQTGQSNHAFDGPSARSQLEASLQALQSDHVDVLLVHSDGDDLNNQRDDYIESLQRLRDEGLTRAIGFSGKTVEGHRKAIEWSDVLMVPMSLTDRSHEPLVQEAQQADVGVLVKKALNSGHLDGDSALRWCWHESPVEDAIASVVVGSVNPTRMQANGSVLSGQG
ncbi:MAG: aldo/keto reductase [Phycisphaerales bacterium]|nr:aldo/keto reductase [Phycisphaerales bacterium]